ncbi:MAG: T9SS type A sorting domain-containing protein [Bacteroidetes bacterium]|nr:T9SS type A sorting domain-containing protein [Bacteroidota bacterium]
MKKIYKSILGLSLLLAGVNIKAQVSAYSFSQTAGVYSAIAGGTVYGSTTSDDEYFVDPAVPLGGFATTGVGIPIGFNFVYNGFTANRIGISNNGWISLGNSTITPNPIDMSVSNSYSSIDATSTAPTSLQNVIASLTRDLQGQAGSSLRVQTLGVTPNQTLVVQFAGYRKYAAAGDNFNFQIRLSETSNLINIVYGTFTTTSAGTAEVGLRGTTNTDFNNRNVTSPTPWANSIAGVVNTALVNFNATLTPVSGQNYRWTPPPICAGAPAASNAVATPTAICAGGNSNLSLSTTYTSTGLTYQWFSAPALAGPYTSIAGANLTTYAATSLTSTIFYKAVITCSVGPASTTATAVQVLVNSNPTVSIVPSSTTICFPSTSTVNLTASGATSYTWSPAASLSSSTGTSVIASPTANTVYSIVGTFTTGCSNTATIAISANPTPSLTATSASVCANSSVAISVSSPSFAYCQPVYSTGTGSGDYIGGVQLGTITNTTTGLATPFYTLYPTSANTTATLTAGSTYTLYLNPGSYGFSNGMAAWIDYNKNGNLADLGEKLGEVTINGAYPTFSVVIFTVPASAFNGTTRFRVREAYFTTNIDPCTGYTYGETEDYNITIVGGANQYNWSPATFLSSTSGSTVVSTPATSTNYTVSTVVNGCTGSATSLVTANTTSISITGASSVCAGGTVNLTASGATTYTWNTAANTASIAASPSVNTTYTAAGTGTNGCVGSATQAVVVNANPTITVAGGTICSGQSFTLSPFGASTYSYSTGPVVSPSVTSSYSVTGTSSVGCASSNTAVASVSVNATPTVSAISSASLICAGQTASLTASGAATYSWNTAATTTVIAISPTVTTSYTVTGSTNGCTNAFVVSQAVSPCTGINTTASSLSGLLVYPNPNTGVFTIELNNGSVKNIDVMDLTGRIVLSNTTSNDKVDFNINTLANGVYYVRIQSNNMVEVIKIVKQ